MLLYARFCLSSFFNGDDCIVRFHLWGIGIPWVFVLSLGMGDSFGALCIALICWKLKLNTHVWAYNPAMSSAAWLDQADFPIPLRSQSFPRFSFAVVIWSLALRHAIVVQYLFYILLFGIGRWFVFGFRCYFMDWNQWRGKLLTLEDERETRVLLG